jgi:hypothetical protein
MPQMAPETRTRTHTHTYCIKWTEDGYLRARRFRSIWEALGFWWKLKYLNFNNIKWEIER